MSDITNEKPHRRYSYGNGYGVSFWKGNAASNEESADRAVVYTGPPGMPYPEMRFELPKDKRQMEDLERMLHKAFEAGKWTALKEVRDVLGVKER